MAARRGRPAEFLLGWRTQYGFGLIEWIILFLFTTVAALTLPYHEPWGDEAQSWLIARDNSFWDIFRHRLHYEGTPLLWPFFLRCLHLLHVPWPAVGFAGAVVALAGVAVFLRFAPFPLLWRLLLPFTFFVQYQYAIVARSYVAFPLLLFALCAIYVSRSPRPLAFAVVAGLLSNLCMQGAVLSGAFTLLYVFDRFREWRAGRQSRPRFQLRAALAVLGMAWLLAVYVAMPAPDVSFAVGGEVSNGTVHQVLMALVGESPRTVTPDLADLRYFAVAGRTLPLPPEPDRHQHFAQWLGWQLRAPPDRRAFSDSTAGVLYPLVELASEVLWPIAVSSLLGCAFLLALAYWGWRWRGLRYFLPALALLLVGEFLWTADHHSGMLLLALFAGVWLAVSTPSGITAASETRAGRPFRPGRRFDMALVLLVGLVLLLQVGWTVHAVRSDRQMSYDPGEATAAFLLSQPPGTRIAAFHFWSTGIQPYFPHNPFFNQLSSWWQWSGNVNTDSSHHRDLNTRPAFVVYTREWPLPDGMRNQLVPLNVYTGLEMTDPVILDILAHGYRTTHVFCGERFSRLSAAYRVCNYVLEPRFPPTVAASAANGSSR